MIILDTNLPCELMKPQPSARVVKWRLRDNQQQNCLRRQLPRQKSFMELSCSPRASVAKGLLAAADTMFAEDLGGRIFGFESDAARSFSTIAAHRLALGRPISHADAQIAAIAQVRGAKLATRNVADFEDCGLDVLDPWDGS
jgi:predicted nucleic acid-binding protein